MSFKNSPVAIGTGVTDIFTCPAGTEATAVIGVANVGGDAATYDLLFYSATLDQTITLASAVSLAANTLAKGYNAPLAMQAGDKISAQASAVNAIVIFATVTQGDQGPQFTGITPKGIYDADTTYAVNDLVSLNGTSYLSRVGTNKGNSPDASTTQWMVLAAKGETGDVSGPASSTDGNFASFNGAGGGTLKDSGKSPADFATAAQGAKADTAVQPDALATVSAVANSAVQPGDTNIDWYSAVYSGSLSNGDLPLDASPPIGFTITKVTAILGAGTAAVQLRLGGTAIGTAISASTTIASDATIDQAVSAGDVLTVNVASASSASDLKLVVVFTRAFNAGT